MHRGESKFVDAAVAAALAALAVLLSRKILRLCRTGGPTLHVVAQLMLRHYSEGAVFAPAAVILFVVAIRRQSWPLALASAFLLLCGAAAREVYAPVILILAALPEGSPRQRLR